MLNNSSLFLFVDVIEDRHMRVSVLTSWDTRMHHCVRQPRLQTLFHCSDFLLWSNVPKSISWLRRVITMATWWHDIHELGLTWSLLHRRQTSWRATEDSHLPLSLSSQLPLRVDILYPSLSSSYRAVHNLPHSIKSRMMRHITKLICQTFRNRLPWKSFFTSGLHNLVTGTSSI